MFALAFCAAATAFGETVTVDEMNLTANVTVDVAEGSTQDVVRLTGGAYTITKTGGGTLNIYWTKNENARIVVEEGVVALPRYAKPTDVFAKAHFHVDASDPSTLETTYVNGTNFVVRWNDADGRTCYATNCPSTLANRTNPENRKPFIRPHFQNGLPVVDFGSLLTANYTDEHGVALGYGGAMLWSEPLTTFREGFTVFSDTEDIFDPARRAYGGHAASLFAAFARAANYRNLIRNGLSAINEESGAFYANIQQCFPLSRSTNVLDLVTYYTANKNTAQPVCTYTAIKKGFHVLNGIANSAFLGSYPECFYADAFAAAKGGAGQYTFGGQRIAEYAVFPEWLSQAERDELSIYLKTKWFPRKFASVDVKAGATFDASAGGFESTFVGTEEGSVLLTGASSVMMNPIHPWKTILHLDASAADTMDLFEVGGTNFVGKWSDCFGNGAYARTNAAESSRAPFINPSETLNGLPFVDFGSLRTPYNTNDVGAALGYGASMKFNGEKNGPEGITVAADTPDVVDGDWLTCPEYAKMRGMSFFSNYTFTYGRGTRGKIESGGTPKIHQYDNQSYYYNGDNYLDGVKLAGSTITYNTRFPSGFHVYSQAPSSASEAVYTHLAAEHCYESGVRQFKVQGGQRIAEYALYKTKLTADERTRAYRALRWKWFAETPLSQAVATLSIPVGGSYKVMYEHVVVGGTLTLGGTLQGLSVSASNVVVSSECATIAAPLTLASGAVLEFGRTDGGTTCLTADSIMAEGNCTVLLKADNWGGRFGKQYRIVLGAVSGGNWTASCSDPKVSAKIVFDAEGAFVELSKGMMIIFK